MHGICRMKQNQCSQTLSAELRGFPKVILKRADLKLTSRLYSLPPIGVGTPFVESLSSYTARLAEAHQVSVAQLLEFEIAPAFDRLRSLSEQQRTNAKAIDHFLSNKIYGINGMDGVAEDFVIALESLTQQVRLLFLTMLPWRDVLSRILLLRRVHAWCPFCLTESRNKKHGVYEQLLWSLQIITICPLHKTKITSWCHHCGKETSILRGRGRSGYCYACEKWLGQDKENLSGTSQRPDANVIKDIKTAHMIGGLIAAAPDLPRFFSASDISKTFGSLKDIIKGNVNALAKQIHFSPRTVNSLLLGESSITLHHLINLCNFLNIFPLDFLNNELENVGVLNIQLPKRRCKENTLKLLRLALEDPSRPSITEVAHNLGYVGYAGHISLRTIDPEICKQITARHWANKKPNPVVKKCERNEAEAILIAALDDDPPPPLKVVAMRIGYHNQGAIYERFPDLCRALVLRRKEHLKRKLLEQETALRAILRRNPPQSLKNTCSELGYKSLNSLTNRFPELCHEIINRYAAFRRKDKELIESTLIAALKEVPPPSLASITRRLGFSLSKVRFYCQELSRQVGQRYCEYERQRGEKRRKTRRKEIRKIAIHLYSKGIYPSIHYVKMEMTDSSYFRPQDIEELRAVQLELGAIKKRASTARTRRKS